MSLENYAEKVKKYYKATEWAFQTVWTGKEDQALHFGLYDKPNMTHAESLLRTNEIMADLVGVEAGDVVVDAGCGYGGTTVWLAKERQCNTIGINIVEPHLEKARQHAKNKGVEDRVNFLLEDFTNTSVEDSSADIFWSMEASVQAVDRLALFREAYRILKPGGKLILVEYFVNHDPYAEHEDIVGYDTILDGGAMPSLWHLPDYMKGLEEAGFSNVRYEDYTKEVLPSFRRMHKMLVAVLPTTRLLLKLKMYNPMRVGHNESCLHLANGYFRNQFRYCAVLANK